MMRFPGGHLGGLVSALVDGQLDPVPAERAWAHVMGCRSCRSAVETETWTKNRLSLLQATQPPAGLAAAIARLACSEPSAAGEPVAAAWAAVGELERRHRRKRVGLVAAGAGSFSAAMIGLGAVSASLDLAQPGPPGAVIGRENPDPRLELPRGRTSPAGTSLVQQGQAPSR